MDSTLILHLARRVLALGVTLIIGFLTGILQAVTSVRDMSMGMVVKLVAVGVTLLVTGGWMIQVAGDFVVEIFNHMQAMGH